jgi:hypothetical protein
VAKSNLKKVYVNSCEIGKAKSWHDAQVLLFQFADKLFEPAASKVEFARASDRTKVRQQAFLKAMGVNQPSSWEQSEENTDEVGDVFQFLFPLAGR